MKINGTDLEMVRDALPGYIEGCETNSDPDMAARARILLEVVERAVEWRADFRLIALDETGAWSLAELGPVGAKIASAWCVYLYDANRVVHLCELTGSYELTPLYQYFNWKNDGTVTDEDRETANEWCIAEMDHDVRYYHCGEIDALVKADERRTHVISAEAVDAEGEDYDYEKVVEALSEYYRSNEVL